MVMRPFIEADYPAFAQLYNRCRPEVAQSEAALRTFDATFRDDLLLNLVAESGGGLVGAVWAYRDASGERQVRLDIVVHPDGLETLPETLYGTVLEQLASYQPTALLVRVREEWVDWLEFYEARGFRELERMWESRLDLEAFDPERFAGVAERAEAAGVTLKTLADLPDDEATQRLLYGTIVELLGDVPFHEPLNIWPFAVWQERFWRSPARRPESFFLAFHGAELVGVSELREGPRPDWLQTGLTGVRRGYRNRGVAFALKLRAAQQAKAAGIAVITTQNHTVNRAMLAINEALGFVKEPAWVRLKRPL